MPTNLFANLQTHKTPDMTIEPGMRHSIDIKTFDILKDLDWDSCYIDEEFYIPIHKDASEDIQNEMLSLYCNVGAEAGIIWPSIEQSQALLSVSCECNGRESSICLIIIVTPANHDIKERKIMIDEAIKSDADDRANGIKIEEGYTQVEMYKRFLEDADIFHSDKDPYKGENIDYFTVKLSSKQELKLYQCITGWCINELYENK